jgi:hypothetical protein
MGQVKISSVFSMLFLLVCISGFTSAPHEPTVNLFRIFNMAFAMKAVTQASDIALNKVYVNLDSARGKPNYHYLALFDNGLMFLSRKSEMRTTKKSYWQWSTFALRGDTIIQLLYELPTLNSRATFFMILYQKVNDSSIQRISNAISLNANENFEQNYRKVASSDFNPKNVEGPYFLTADIVPPPPRNCKFLRHAYFWQSDSLYNEYKNNKIEIQ